MSYDRGGDLAAVLAPLILIQHRLFEPAQRRPPVPNDGPD